MKVRLLVSAASLCGFPSVAVAQAVPTAPAASVPQGAAPADDASGLQDIVVTAQKRSERLNDVPLSITALSGDQLASRGITDPSQLERVVPGFVVQKSFTGQPVYFIRGVGFSDSVISINPAVSIYTDETPLPFSAMARGAALDLERVEVLKGPQGTLFGENATGGAVNYIAAKPTDILHAGFDLTVGRFDQVNATAFVSGPLSDKIAVRVSVANEYQGDWQYSLSRPGDTRGQQRFTNGRAIVDFKPSDGIKFELSGQAWADRSDLQQQQFVLAAPNIPVSPPGLADVIAALNAQQPAPNNARAADWDAGSPTARDDRFYQGALRGTFDLTDTISLTSLTSYSNLRASTPIDADGTPYRNAFFQINARLEDVSQELRIAGRSGRFNWLAGVNYMHQNTRETQTQFVNATNASVGPFRYSQFFISDNQKVNSYAGFGSADFKIGEAITVRGSARYTKEDRAFNGCLGDTGNGEMAAAFGLLSTILSGTPTTIAPGSCITLSDTTAKPLPTVYKSLNQHNFSWRAGIDWKPAPATLLYATVAKGYKSGAFTTIPAVFASQLDPVTQESVMAYETGVKIGLFHHRLQLNAAAFYYDYRNKQLGGFANIQPFGDLPKLVNIPKSSVKGIEFDLTARVTPHLRVTTAGTYLDTKVKADPVNPTCPVQVPGIACSFVGERFPNTPKFQLTGDIEQSIPLDARHEAYVGASVLYHSATVGVFGANAVPALAPAFQIPAYTLIDLRAGVRLDQDKLTIEVFGRNVTNKFYLINATRSFEELARYTGMPATYGARLIYRY